MNDEQLTQRMRAASEAVQMSDSVQARHLQAISAALESAATPDADVIALTTAGTTRRRRIVASVVAAAVMAPAGLAAASEDSLPGDALYPVKQISERVLVLFDSDVIAEHRIEEIEALEASGRVDEALYDDARAALSELGEDHPLWQRLASATPPEEDGDQTPVADDDRSDDDSTTEIAAEFELPDGARATVTVIDDALMGLQLPQGWKATEIDDDGATLVHEDYVVEVRWSDGSLSLEVTERDQPESHDDDSSEAETTSGSDVSDDDESSESVTSATSPGGDREDDSDPAETDSSDDDDASESD